MKRVLVTGGRFYSNRAKVYEVLDACHAEGEIGILIQGACTKGGADLLAHEWAISREVPSLSHPARWKKFGKGAGPIRNSCMLTLWKPQIVIAFPGDGGTKDMTDKANQAGCELRAIVD